MKKIYFKIYDSAGDLVKEAWEDARFDGFSKRINGGLGPCLIRLGRKFDDYGEYEDVALNNEVRIYIVDEDTDKEYGTLIYLGYISQYSPVITREGREEVLITLMGYYTKLAQDIWKDGTTTTFSYAAADLGATDIGTIFRSLMDRYIAETDALEVKRKLSYTDETIEQTSTTTEYKFESLTYRQGIDILKGLAPTDWYWWVGVDNLVHFTSPASSPDHRFIFGRHLNDIKAVKSMEKIKNAVLFYDNGDNSGSASLRLYTDTGSVDDHGRRVHKMNDSRVKQTTDIDKIAEKFIAEHKDPDVKVIASIIDNNGSIKGYDIESINPGDTCEFVGFDVTLSETLKYNMVIKKVDYKLDRARITVEPMEAGVIERTEELNLRLDELEREDVPISYTAV